MKNITKFFATIAIGLFSTSLCLGQSHATPTNAILYAKAAHHRETTHIPHYQNRSHRHLRKDINQQLPVFLYYQKVEKFEQKIEKDVQSKSTHSEQ